MLVSVRFINNSISIVNMPYAPMDVTIKEIIFDRFGAVNVLGFQRADEDDKATFIRMGGIVYNIK